MTPPPQATFVSSAVPMRRKRYSSGPASSTSILLLPLLPLVKLACCSSSDSSSVAAREHPFESEVLLALMQDLTAANPSPGSSIRSDRNGSDTKNDSNTIALNSITHNDSNSNQSHGRSFANGTSSSGSSGGSGVVSSLPVSFTSTDFAASSHVSVPTAAPDSAASDTSRDSSSSFSSPARFGPSWPPLSALPPSSPASVPSFSPPSPSALSSLGPRGPSLEHSPALLHEAPRPTAPHTADRSARGAAAASSSAAFSVATSWPSPLFSSRVFSSPRPFSSAGAPGAGGEDEAASTAAVPKPAARYAVLVVPGIAGSGLFARITEAKLPACAARAVTYDSFRIWAALSLVLPPLSHQKCWVDMMQQQVDEKGEVYQSKPGVELQVDDYGGIHAIDFLDYYMHDSYGIPGSAYMHGMLQTLQKLHYQPFTTLRGVPYDWRLPPWQFDFSRLKADIEERYEATGQQKVDLLAHSLGTVILCYFFNKVVDQAWKNKYIKTFTLVGAATGGSFKAIKCLLSGYDTAKDLNVWSVLDVNFFPTTLLRDLLRSMGSTYALLPDPQLYGSDRVVATVLHPPPAATPSPSSPVLLPWTVGGSGGGREGASKFEGIEAEGGELRGHGVGGEGAGGSRDGADDEAAFDLPTVELRRRRLLAEEQEDELESATAGPSNGRPSHAEEKRRREKQQLQQQEQVRWAAEREYAARSRMSDEERQRLRNERTHAYVQEQQQRLQEVYEKMAKEDIPKDVYTLANWTSLLPPDLQQRAKVAREKMSGIFADPGVPVRCVWSSYDTPTTDVAYVYDTGNLDRMPIPVFGFGDDTVPVESLSLCRSWPSTVEKHELKNVDHMYIFADKSFNRLVASMYGPPPPHEEGAPVSPQPLPPAILVTS